MNGKENFNPEASQIVEQLGYTHFLLRRLEHLKDREGVVDFKIGDAPFEMDLIIPGLAKVHRSLITDLERMGQGDYVQAYLKYLDSQDKI